VNRTNKEKTVNYNLIAHFPLLTTCYSLFTIYYLLSADGAGKIRSLLFERERDTLD
jgi:hypothetical protein